MEYLQIDKIFKFLNEISQKEAAFKNINVGNKDLEYLFDNYINKQKVIDYSFYNDILYNDEIVFPNFNFKKPLPPNDFLLEKIEKVFETQKFDLFYKKFKYLMVIGILYSIIEKYFLKNKINFDKEKLLKQIAELVEEYANKQILELNVDSIKLFLEDISNEYEIYKKYDESDFYTKTIKNIKNLKKFYSAVEKTAKEIEFYDIVDDLPSLEYPELLQFLKEMEDFLEKIDENIPSKTKIKKNAINLDWIANKLDKLEGEIINTEKVLIETKENFIYDMLGGSEYDYNTVLLPLLDNLTEEEKNYVIKNFVETGLGDFNYLVRLMLESKFLSFNNYLVKYLKKEKLLNEKLKKKIFKIITDQFQNISQNYLGTSIFGNDFVTNLEITKNWNNEENAKKFLEVFKEDLQEYMNFNKENKEIKNIKVAQILKEITGNVFLEILKDKGIIFPKNYSAFEFVEENKDLNNKYIRNILINLGSKIFRKNGIEINGKIFNNFFEFMEQKGIDKKDSYFAKYLKKLLELKENKDFEINLRGNNFKIELNKSDIKKLSNNFAKLLKEIYQIYGKEVLINSKDPLVSILNVNIKKAASEGIVALTDIRTYNEIKEISKIYISEIEKDNNNKKLQKFIILLPSKNKKILKDKLKINELKEAIKKIKPNSKEDNLRYILEKYIPSLKDKNGNKLIMNLEELNHLLPLYLIEGNTFKNYNWYKELKQFLETYFDVSYIYSDRIDRDLLFKQIEELNKKLDKGYFILLGPSGVGKDTILEIIQYLRNSNKIEYGYLTKAENYIKESIEKGIQNSFEKDMTTEEFLENIEKLAEKEIKPAVNTLLSIRTFKKLYSEMVNKIKEKNLETSYKTANQPELS